MRTQPKLMVRGCLDDLKLNKPKLSMDEVRLVIDLMMVKVERSKCRVVGPRGWTMRQTVAGWTINWLRKDGRI